MMEIIGQVTNICYQTFVQIWKIYDIELNKCFIRSKGINILQKLHLKPKIQEY